MGDGLGGEAREPAAMTGAAHPSRAAQERGHLRMTVLDWSRRKFHIANQTYDNYCVFARWLRSAKMRGGESVGWVEPHQGVYARLRGLCETQRLSAVLAIVGSRKSSTQPTESPILAIRYSRDLVPAARLR